MSMTPQVPSDNSGNFTRDVAHSAGQSTVTQTFTIPRLTRRGSDGSFTVVNGRVTAYTPPT